MEKEMTSGFLTCAYRLSRNRLESAPDWVDPVDFMLREMDAIALKHFPENSEKNKK